MSSSSSQELILYDLPSRPNPAGKTYSWSPNVWKTRLVLNYKSIPYTTHWLPFTKLQATLAATDLQPNPPPEKSNPWHRGYSVPTIRFPDGSHMMDSLKLAEKLEEMKPDPSLSLEVGLHQEARTAIGAIFNPMLGFFMPRIVERVVAEEDIEWFHADRAKKFGMSLAELKRKEGGPEAFKNAQEGLDQAVEVLRKHKRDAGPFILGSVPSYGDFILVAGLHCFMVLEQNYFDKIVEGRRELRELYEACGPWLAKDD